MAIASAFRPGIVSDFGFQLKGQSEHRLGLPGGSGGGLCTRPEL